MNKELAGLNSVSNMKAVVGALIRAFSVIVSALRDLNEQKMYMQRRRKARLTTERMKYV